MRHEQGWFAVALLLSAGTAVPAQRPRAIVEQAVRGMGGEDVLSRVTATRETINYSEFRCRKTVMQSGVRRRCVFEGESPFGEKRLEMYVTDGVAGWVRTNDGQVREMSPDELQRFDLRKFDVLGDLENAASLLPLLKDKSYFLAPLPEESVDGRPAHCIRASHRQRVDVVLFFDQESGLLVKALAKVRTEGEMRAGLMVFHDYHEVGPTREDEELLLGAGVSMSGTSLLTFLRKQVRDPTQATHRQSLINRLGDDSFEEREKATREIIRLGRVVVPDLQQALRDPDAEVVRRVRECLDRIVERGEVDVLTSAVRLVGWRRPDGGCQALLDLLPSAEEALAAELKAALVVYAERDGKPDPALLWALDDADPVRRSAACGVLGRDGGDYLRQPGRRVYLHGLRQPAIRACYTSGTFAEITEMRPTEYFNDFDPRLFARP
jgi:hypothetical protein